MELIVNNDIKINITKYELDTILAALIHDKVYRTEFKLIETISSLYDERSRKRHKKIIKELEEEYGTDSK